MLPPVLAYFVDSLEDIHVSNDHIIVTPIIYWVKHDNQPKFPLKILMKLYIVYRLIRPIKAIQTLNESFCYG